MQTGRIEISEDGELFTDELVVGCTMESMLFADEYNLPVVYSTQDYPHFFEEASLKEYAELCFYLSVHGLNPFGEMPERLRLDVEDDCLSVFCGPKTYRVYYNKAYVFSDKELGGLPEPSVKNKNYKVLDWLDVTCEAGVFDTIHSESDFVSSVHFYPSLRTSRSGYADAVAVSYMNKRQLSDPAWCDSYVRLKAINLISSAGIKGGSNGPDRHRRLEVNHSHREVIPINKNVYPEIPNVEFR